MRFRFGLLAAVNLNADDKDLADLYFGEGDTLRVADDAGGPRGPPAVRAR